jgi:large subunit ribosomal protein L9
MEVILTRDVESIGKAGSVIKVSDGYARNFLFPKKLALQATAGNVKELAAQQAAKERQNEQFKQKARALKERIEKLSLTIPVLTQDKEKLYGSIGALELSRALADEGLEIDKGVIVIDEPLKDLGIFEVPVKLHAEVTATLKVWIVKK